MPAQTSSGRPLSRNDLRLDRTRGQPSVMPFSISEPGCRRSWTTVRRTMSPTGSRAKLTREWFALFAASGGAAHVTTSRLGGVASTTSPTTIVFPESPPTCFHDEPGFQSETLEFPQYLRLRSASVSAFQIFSGVDAI